MPIYEELENRERANRLEVDKLYEKILKGSYPELYSNTNIEPRDFLKHI